jgi:hypothetical protein
MIITKINSKSNTNNIEIDISISELKAKVNNFELVIIKNCLDKNKLLEIKKSAYEFAEKNEPSNPGNTSNFLNYSFHRIDNNVPAMKKKCIDHMYKFGIKDCPSKYFFEIVDRVDNFRNKLFGLKSEDFIKNDNEKGIVSRPVIKQYPIGGGYMIEHTDTSDPAPLQLLVPLSTKTLDFNDGGLQVFCPKVKKWVELENEIMMGDIILHRPDLLHKVSPIDHNQELNWNSIRGKWTLVAILDRIH